MYNDYFFLEKKKIKNIILIPQIQEWKNIEWKNEYSCVHSCYEYESGKK